jgi:hypothetical protein
MRLLLGGLVLILNTLDNATTFFCLRAPVEGLEIVEANPIARWLFESLGLVEGLVLESALTLGAVIFLVRTPTLSSSVRNSLLFLLIALPAWAVANNLRVMSAIAAGV